KTETRNTFQLEALETTYFNGLDGRRVSQVLTDAQGLWTELVFSGDAIYLLPADGCRDELGGLFADPRSGWDDDDQDRPAGAKIFPNELDWKDIDGQTYLRAWWD
ncbi:MAG TPA: hypothetical protein VFQ54_11010, partial [Thermomicrobiales bacterium]|nr:hypothetical protein [Thermomicrobiales bacterium]